MCALHSLEAAAKTNIICKSRLKWVGPLKINEWPLSLQQHGAGLLVTHATLHKKTPQASSLVCQSLNLQEVQNLQLALQPWLLAQD
jgi:hypothetical protein